MDVKYEVKNAHLIITNSNREKITYVAEANIYSHVLTPRGIAIITESPTRELEISNVFLIGFDGKLIWRIEDARKLHDPSRELESYIYIWMEDNTLVVRCWSDAEWEIDLNTGKRVRIIRHLKY